MADAVAHKVIIRPGGTWEEVTATSGQLVVVMTDSEADALRTSPPGRGYPPHKDGNTFSLEAVINNAIARAGRTSEDPPVRLGDCRVVRSLRDVPMDEIIHELSYRRPSTMDVAYLDVGAEVQALCLPADGRVPKLLHVTLEDSPEGGPSVLFLDDANVWSVYGQDTRGLYHATVENWMILCAQWAYQETVRQSIIELRLPKGSVTVHAADDKGWKVTDLKKPAFYLKVCGPTDSDLILACDVCIRTVEASLQRVSASGYEAALSLSLARSICRWWTEPRVTS